VKCPDGYARNCLIGKIKVQAEKGSIASHKRREEAGAVVGMVGRFVVACSSARYGEEPSPEASANI
jgi:hypothetical protein